MCIAVKYGIWNVGQPESAAVNALVSSGYAPLTAMVLSARGIDTPAQAQDYLNCEAEMYDPFLMTDMDLAAGNGKACGQLVTTVAFQKIRQRSQRRE